MCRTDPVREEGDRDREDPSLSRQGVGVTYVRRADEDGVEVLRISNALLNSTLDIKDDDARARARRLLQEADLIRPHRKSKGPDVDGWTLPPDWQPEHLGHLRTRARALLAEHGLTAEPKVGRISWR
jgi:hypothetical protein